jgi:hypothetical protein
MRRDRNSFWHSLFDGGGVPTDYIMVNRPDMISIVITTIGEKLDKSGRKKAVQRLNLFARVFFPIVVLVTVTVFGTTYSNSLI